MASVPNRRRFRVAADARAAQERTQSSELALDNARAKGDGPGDHARSAAAFLTGAHPFKTAGANIKVGVSMDQVAAARIGNRTRLPSLELGLDKGQMAGNCDSGYSCAYVSNISWRSENTPMPKEVDPAVLFERLFGSDADRETAARERRIRQRRSVLDFAMEDAKRLNAQLGREDQRKLDEFTTSLREVETRLDAARAQNRPAQAPTPDMARPQGIPREFTEHFRLMLDLLVLAFRTDSTRIATFMVGRDGSDRTYRWLDLREGHHTVSHHGNATDKILGIRKIDLYHIQQLAWFLEKLKSIPEGNGNLLDNSMILIGSGISDGDRHNHDDLPVLLAGRAAGALPGNRHLLYPRNTPMCNLYVQMLNLMGAKTQPFGDSTGQLPGLLG